jgi:K+-sensing histidine kinase KdpD
LFDTLNNVINAERVQLLSAPAERDFLRNCILFSLGVAILMSVVLAAMLSRMYTARITKPLECLSENAKKLSKNDPLSEVRSDYAEMNSLDGTLREVESLLAKARTNEQSLIQNAAQLICTIDKSLRVESANDACLNILGRQPETIKDQLITQYLKSEETEMLLQNLKAARNSSTGQEFELEMENNNKLDPVFTKWSVLWSELEQKYFCIIHDISGRKQWEQLRQSYLNMISDDIRKPLEEVQTTLDSVSSDILQRELSVDPVARRNSKWLLELVCDLLDYENLQAGKLNFQMQLCKMDEILSRALSIASPLAKPRNIDFIQTGSECMVYGDEKKLVQLFANVLVNAVKFSPECGKIQINRTQLDKYVMISIIDEGEGISADLQQRLFQPFEQDDKKQDRQKGIGLGLAICKLIADSHHAQIGIDSDENHGTTFWLKIPTTEL